MTLLSLLMVGQAQAIEFRWWGVGPMVGTRIIPLEYPVFPAIAEDADGDLLIDKVNGNLEMGIHAALYAGNIGRVGLRGQLNTNFGPWFAQEVTIEWDHLLVRDGELQLMLGAGIGVGHQRFGDKTTDAYLDLKTFPIRAQVSGLMRDKWRGYEIDIYGTLPIAGQTQMCSGTGGNDTCTEPGDTKDLTDGVAFYGGLGLEATVFFGNFKSAKVD